MVSAYFTLSKCRKIAIHFDGSNAAYRLTLKLLNIALWKVGRIFHYRIFRFHNWSHLKLHLHFQNSSILFFRRHTNLKRLHLTPQYLTLQLEELTVDLPNLEEVISHSIPQNTRQFNASTFSWKLAKKWVNHKCSVFLAFWFLFAFL